MTIPMDGKRMLCEYKMIDQLCVQALNSRQEPDRSLAYDI